MCETCNDEDRRDERSDGGKRKRKRKRRRVDEPIEEYATEPGPEEVPREELPFLAGKDAKRPPREEETPVSPGPPPHAPLAREDLGGRSGTNR